MIRAPAPVEAIVDTAGRPQPPFLAVLRALIAENAALRERQEQLIAALVDEGSLPGDWDE